MTLAVAENEPLISAAATASERGPSRGELLLVSVPTLAALVLRLMMLTSPGHLTSDGVWCFATNTRSKKQCRNLS